MKVLAFTNLFPSAIRPAHGIFMQHRLQHLAALPDVQLRVLAPVPWFPLKARMFGYYAMLASIPAEDVSSGLHARFIRYAMIPKVGMWLSPFTMALSMARETNRLRASGFDPDMIDAYYLYPDGVAACLAGRFLGIPVTLTALGSDVSKIGRRRVPAMMIRWALRRAKATTAVCTALVNAMEDMGAEPEKLHTVEHGVDLKLFDMPVDREAVREVVGFGRFTILSVGHLITRKGHDLAIEAVSRIPAVDLVIIGGGPERQALEALAGRLGISDRVRFAGQLDQPRLAAMLGAADLLINCSDREGIANVLLEALACGTPVAATPVWGSPEVIVNDAIGIMFEARSVDAIASGIAAATARSWNRPAIRQHAMRYSWPETAKKHYRIMTGEGEPAGANSL